MRWSRLLLPDTADILVEASELERFIFEALDCAGAGQSSAQCVADALVKTSLRGVDSHGVRLLVHYIRAIEGGRVLKNAKITYSQTGPSTGVLDAGDGFGHPATYAAADQAIILARETGVGTVAVRNSSHCGAMGCYALAIADQNMIGFGTCNSDSFVLPHDGIKPFYGTNPIALAAPVPGSRPLLVDMAISMVPWNRVQDYLAKGLALPPDVTVDRNGKPTTDPQQSASLLPLGGSHFGFKGAALAALVEVFSAVLTGSPHCGELPAMAGPDFTQPRHLGHFVLAIDPSRFVCADRYNTNIQSFLSMLRATPSRAEGKVMAPGDREWATEDERSTRGIPLARVWADRFRSIADNYGIAPLEKLSN